MKISGITPKLRVLVGLILVGLVAQLQAAPLNIPVPYPDPDVTSNGLDINYVYTGGASNTLTITGPGGLASSQLISYPTGGDGVIVNDLGCNQQTSGFTCTHTGYNLTANFAADGSFIDGTVVVEGYAALTDGFFDYTADSRMQGYASGTILELSLTDFGFTGAPTTNGDRDTLLLEWSGIIIGGDIASIGYGGQVGGAQGGGDVFYGSTGTYGGAWDPNLDNTMTAFTDSFYSCATCGDFQMNTFVPVPAAVWLFSSGLLGLLGVARRKRRAL